MKNIEDKLLYLFAGGIGTVYVMLAGLGLWAASTIDVTEREVIFPHVVEREVYKTVEHPLCRPENPRDVDFAVRVVNDLPWCTLIRPGDAERKGYTYCRPVWGNEICQIINGELPDDQDCY